MIDRYYAAFDERVRKIVAYGYEHSPALRRRMEAAGLRPADIQTVADLGRLPVLRKAQLVEIQQQGEQLGGLLTVPPGRLRRLFQSPGPIYEPEPDVEDPWRWAPAFRAAGFMPGDILFNAFSYHLTPAAVQFEEGAREVGCVVIPGGVGNQVQQINAIKDLGVTGYIGLPSYLKALLEKAREMGHEPRRWPLRRAIVTAEPLPPSLRALLQERYGIEVYGVYGTAECGNLGYEGRARDGWHLPGDALVQICDINSGEPLPPGETGEVVVTLFRRDYILVRLALGDLSALRTDPPPPGDPATPRLAGWLGRSDDKVKVRGLFVHPRHVAEALQGIEEVDGYQIVITREQHRDEMTCRLLPAPGVDTDTLTATVAGALQAVLKLRCNVEPVDHLPEEADPFVDERSWE